MCFFTRIFSQVKLFNYRFIAALIYKYIHISSMENRSFKKYSPSNISRNVMKMETRSCAKRFIINQNMEHLDKEYLFSGCGMFLGGQDSAKGSKKILGKGNWRYCESRIRIKWSLGFWCEIWWETGLGEGGLGGGGIPCKQTGTQRGLFKTQVDYLSI